jgi:hypothetical protein
MDFIRACANDVTILAVQFSEMRVLFASPGYIRLGSLDEFQARSEKFLTIRNFVSLLRIGPGYFAIGCQGDKRYNVIENSMVPM